MPNRWWILLTYLGVLLFLLTRDSQQWRSDRVGRRPSSGQRRGGRWWRQVCPTPRCRCKRLGGGLHLKCNRPLENVPRFTQSNLTFNLVTLSQHNLTYIPDRAFSAIHIRRLDLRGNLFSAGISKDAFHNLQNTLEVLQLSNCRLHEIPMYSISMLHMLKVLNMEDNNIYAVRINSFEGNTHLLDLSLYRNNIHSIETGAFYGLSRLQQLKLFQNQLQSISRKSLRGMSNLTSLDLSKNTIARLRSGIFRDLKKLTWLALESNLLTFLSKKTFKGLNSLKYLNLANNPLEAVGDGTFHAIRRLKYLSLDIGNVTSLSNGTFTRLHRLKTFNIGEVNRTSLPKAIFGDMARLKSFSVWDYAHIFSGLTPKYFSHKLDYKKFSIWTNPVHECHCKVKWIRRLTKKGAYVHGYCSNRQPVSCKRRISKVKQKGTDTPQKAS